MCCTSQVSSLPVRRQPETTIINTMPYTTFSVVVCFLWALRVNSASLMRSALSAASACVGAMGRIMLFHCPIDESTGNNAGDHKHHKTVIEFRDFLLSVKMKLLGFRCHGCEFFGFILLSFSFHAWGGYNTCFD